MGNLFKPSKQTTTSSSQVNLPGWASSGLQAVGERATNLMATPYQAYGGQRVAGASPWLNQGQEAVAGAAGYQPQQVAPQQVGGQRVAARSLAGSDLSAYQNPFEQQVIDATMADIDRGTRVAQAGRAAGGVQAAGFGGFGDRSAVAGAEIERAALDTKARTVAGLRSQGFQRAQDMAVGDIGREYAGDLATAQFGQQAGLANQQAGLVAGQANQQAGLAANQQRLAGGQSLAQLGEIERAIRQGGLDFDYQQFREARDYPFLTTQWGAGVIGGAAAPYGSQVTQTGTTPGPSPFGQIAGAATAAAGLAGLFSAGGVVGRRHGGMMPGRGHRMRRRGGMVAYADGGMVPLREEIAERLRRAMPTRPGTFLGGGDEFGLGPVIEGEAEVVREAPPGGRMYPSPRAGGVLVPFEQDYPMASRWRAPEPDAARLPPLPDGSAWADTREGAVPGGAYAGPGAMVSDGGGRGMELVGLPRVGAAGGSAGEPWGDSEGAWNGGYGETLPYPPPPAPPVPRGMARASPSAAADGPSPAAAGAAGAAAPPGAANLPVPVQAALAALSGPSAAPSAEPAVQGNWFSRFGRRLADPDNAGSLALITAGMGMMASRNPNWAGAIGEGAMAGAAAIERGQPVAVARQREATRAATLRALLGGTGLPDDTVAPERAPASRPAVSAGASGSLGDRVAAAESGGDPSARNPNSSASGTFQITDGHWREWAPRLGLPDSARNDPAAQRAIFEAYAAEERRALEPVLGRPVRDEDIYASWGLGQGGFRALASADPRSDAFDVYSRAAGPRVAEQAFRVNGPLMRPGMTSGEVLDAWRGRLRNQRAGGNGDAAPEAAERPEPSVRIGARSFNRGQLMAAMAATADDPGAQRLFSTALAGLDRDEARRESVDERRSARDEAAALRLTLAQAGRAPQPSSLSRLIGERDALPPGDPRRASFDAAIRRETGEQAGERWTPSQVVALRRDATNAARVEAGQLDFDTEADRSSWIVQRGRELLREWGAPEQPGGSSSMLAPLTSEGVSGVPDDAGAVGPRVVPRRANRTLTDRARNDLVGAGEAAASFPSLVESWQPEFGGFMLEGVGDAANFIARNTPGESPRADWWARYQEQKNLLRNRLFGSALTRTEKEQFDRAAINPGMSAEAVESRLSEMSAAAQRAAAKLARSYLEAGYSRREVEAALGMPIPVDVPGPGRAGAVSRPVPSRGAAPPAARAPAPNPLERFMQ